MGVSLVTEGCSDVGTSQGGCRAVPVLRLTVGEMAFSGPLAFRV